MPQALDGFVRVPFSKADVGLDFVVGGNIAEGSATVTRVRDRALMAARYVGSEPLVKGFHYRLSKFVGGVATFASEYVSFVNESDGGLSSWVWPKPAPHEVGAVQQ